MPDFSFPSWMTPKETPWDALLKGAQVGNMIAQNRFRNQQLYQQVQQQGVENDLREREFMVRSEAQNLHSQAMRRKFDGDTTDLPRLNQFLQELQGETDADTLRSKGIPDFNNFENYSNAQRALTGRLQAISGIDAERIRSDTTSYNLKAMDSLDPDLRQWVMPHMGHNGLLNEDGIGALQLAKEQQMGRNEEAKLHLQEATSKITEGRQIAVEKVKNQYRAGLRGAVKITDKAKLSAFNNELHAITFDPLLTTEEKGSKQQAIMDKYGVKPNFNEMEGGEVPEFTPEQEANIYDTEIKNIQKEIDQKNIALAKSPDKQLMDFGTDNRVLDIQKLQGQKTRLEALRKGQSAPAVEAQSKALPLPATKESLVKGSLYQTTKGLAIWDGEQFIAQ